MATAREVPRPAAMVQGGEDLDGLLLTWSELMMPFTRRLIDCYSITIHSDRPQDLFIAYRTQTISCPSLLHGSQLKLW